MVLVVEAARVLNAVAGFLVVLEAACQAQELNTSLDILWYQFV